MICVTLRSVRECINLTELAVSDDVADRGVTIAAETLETGFVIDCGDCKEAEDADVSRDERGRRRVFC